MSDAHDIGRVLKKLREDAGLSQRQLAEELGVQQPAVARWEAGGVRMPVNRIDEILSHFGYGVEYNLTAVPVDEALNGGLPLRMVRRRPTSAGHEPLEVVSGNYRFAVDPETGSRVAMWELGTGRTLPGAVALYGGRISGMVGHPDGVLVRVGKMVAKIVPSANRDGDGNLVFALFQADEHDLELAGVAGDPTWPSPGT